MTTTERRSRDEQPPALGKLPPYDLEAECAVVASCLVDDEAYGRLQGLLEPGEFFQEKHGQIFAAIGACATRGAPTNTILVADELARRNQLDDLGGLAYLSQLTTELPTAVGVEFYAGLVRRDATYRRLISAAGRMAQIGYDGGAELDEALARCQALLALVQRPLPGRGWRTIGQITAERRADLLERARNPKASRGISTGLRALDRLLSGRGLIPGKTYVIGGATSMGKSTLLRVILRNIALQGKHVALLTLEQDEEEVLEELAYGLAQIDRHAHESEAVPLSQAELDEFAWALDYLQDLHTIHVDDSPGLTAQDVKTRLSRLCSQHPIKVVGVDYLHILASEKGKRDQTREREIARMAEVLRDAAKELGVALLLMSQLNFEVVRPERRKQEFRPTLRDFRDSGAVTHLPYAVLGIYRRDYYVEQGLLEPRKWVDEHGRDCLRGDRGARPWMDGYLDCLVLKQQRACKGMARLAFRGALSSIEDVAGSEPAERSN